MDSDLIRNIQEDTKPAESIVFKVGDSVLARWSDSKVNLFAVSNFHLIICLLYSCTPRELLNFSMITFRVKFFSTMATRKR